MRKRLPNGCYRTGLIFNKQVFKEVAQLSHLFFCAYLPDGPLQRPQPRPPAVRLRPCASGFVFFALCLRPGASGFVFAAWCFWPCVSGRAFADPFLCWCAGVAVVCHLPRCPYVSLPYRPGVLLVLLVHSYVPACSITAD